MLFRYAGVIAINPNTDQTEIVKSATGTVHLNENWDIPVEVHDVNGFAMTTLNTTVEGLFPDFYVEDQPVVGFKTSSGHRFYLRSSTPVPGPPGMPPVNVRASEGSLVFDYEDGTAVPGPSIPTPEALADGQIAGLLTSEGTATGVAVRTRVSEAVAADTTVADAAATAVADRVAGLNLLTSDEDPDSTTDSVEYYDDSGVLLYAIDGVGSDTPRLRGGTGPSAPAAGAGYVLRPSGDTTGATDTAAVNAALIEHPLVVLAPGQWWQNGSYVIPSSTRMHCEGPFESTLVAGSNSNLVTNEIGVLPRTNIALTGSGHVRFNGNAANQTRLDTSPNHAGWRNHGLHFVNLDGLYVSGITWANTAMFGAMCTGVRNSWWKDNRVEQDFSQPNQDGLDIGPACYNIWIDGLTGNTEDDVHSIFAKYSTSQKTVHSLYLAADALYAGSPAGELYSAEGNNTHDIHVHRSHVNAGKNFFRLQAAEGSKLYNIYGDDIRHTGTTICRALAIFGEMISAYIKAPPAADGSDFYNINFRGFEGGVESLLYLDSHVRGVTVRDAHLTKWAQIISQKSSTDTPANFSRLSIDGVTSTATASTDIGNVMTLTAGMVARDVEVRNLNLAAVKRLIANTDSTIENVRMNGYVGSISAEPFFLGGTATTTGRVRVEVGAAVPTTGPLPTPPANSTIITTEGA